MISNLKSAQHTAMLHVISTRSLTTLEQRLVHVVACRNVLKTEAHIYIYTYIISHPMASGFKEREGEREGGREGGRAEVDKRSEIVQQPHWSH